MTDRARMPARRTSSALAGLTPAAACALVMALALWLGTPAARAQTLLPSLPQQQNVGIIERRGEQVPLDLVFTNSRGNRVPLSDYFDGKRPVVLVMAYYTCPLLCTKMLNEVQATLNKLDWTLGKEYRVLTVSFDHRNTVAEAREKQTAYLAGYAREASEASWEFMVGDVDTIRTFAGAVGFQYKFLPESGEFSHPSALIFLSPTGKISTYLERLAFDPRDVKLALSEAADNKVGTVFDRVISFCFVYNPNTGRYTMVAKRVMAIGAAASVVALMMLVGGLAFARSRRLRALGARDGRHPGGPVRTNPLDSSDSSSRQPANHPV